MTDYPISIAFDVPPDGPRPGVDAAVDFINTAGISRGKPFEDLTTLDDTIHWLHAAGYLTHEAALPFAPAAAR